ncbi:MAG: DUF3140 domain-containing protein [Nocardiopsaceae bacterium]|nr:DUF3140 domain-containing protein [Nocardiopsaceae bacterium]
MARDPDPTIDELWQEFHDVVNMTGEELRRWLLTDASGPDVFTPRPDLGVAGTGRQVVRILDKRRMDLTSDDVETMRGVVGTVRDLLAEPEPHDDAWRHRLMSLGHDPLRPV